MSAFKTGEDIVKALAETRQKYDEEWAITSNNYIIGVPSKDKLIKRTQMIDEIYEIQKEIKKLNKNSLYAINPNEWRDPPEYCYEDLLMSMVGLLKEELKNSN